MKPYIAPKPPALDGAACRNHDLNIWFNPEHTDQARAICATCPTKQACLDYALTLPVDTEGIYAGLTQAELHKPRRQNGNPTPIKHGTTAGYQAHFNQGIPPCDSCREAHAIYTRERKAKKLLQAAQPREINIVHGTHSGYVQHHQHGIPTCDPCRAAHAHYMRNWTRKRRERNKAGK